MSQCADTNYWDGGTIDGMIEIIDSDDLFITIENNLKASDGYVKELGFQYTGGLSGLSLDAFTVLNGTVADPTLTTSDISSFAIDLGFDFQNDNNSPVIGGRFESGEKVEITVLTTTGTIDLSMFTLGIAGIGGVGNNACCSLPLTGEPYIPIDPDPGPGEPVPSPATLALLGLGLAVLRWSRKRS